MRILIFGATGMVGNGVLRECLDVPMVTEVLAVGRSETGMTHPKLKERQVADLFDLPLAGLEGFDACFFCLGVSSQGMSEADYQHLTYDLTLAVARQLAGANPAMTFIYVSGAGTDSTEKSHSMWARIKGRTENALARLPFKAVHHFRPGLIEPLDGIRSKTTFYRRFYRLTGPVLPLLRRLFPEKILTTRDMGRAMLSVARRGWPKRVLEPKDIAAASWRYDPRTG